MGLDPKGRNIARQVFSINVLSLYLFRRGIGFVLAAECCVRAAFFVLSPDGHFSFLSQKSSVAGSLSVVELALGLSGILLALGYHRVIWLVFTWALLLLRFYPDFGQTSYGFKILQSVFFWTVFLPSTDQRLYKNDWLTTNAFSLASVGALLQIAIIYLSAGITKSSGCWWGSGEALYRTIAHSSGNEAFRTVLEYEGLLRLMSRLVFATEILAPVLLLSPVKTDVFRTIAVAFFISMHVGIAIFMKIGVFAYLCLGVWVLFLPTGFWRWMRKTREFAIDEPSVGLTRAQTSVLCLALVYVSATILAQWQGARAYTSLRKVGYTIGLDQQWIMFNNPCRFPERDTTAVR
jgi:hypothetical protein